MEMLWGPSEQGCTDELRVTGEGPRSLCCSSALISTPDLNSWLRAERDLKVMVLNDPLGWGHQ